MRSFMNKKIHILNIVVAIILFYGAIANPKILWNTVDIGAGILAIINCFSIIMLYNVIKKEVDYDR